MLMKKFGEIFTMLYKDSGYTQVDIAKKLNVSHPTVFRWQEQESIDAAMLEKICRMFRYPIVNFFDEDVITGSNRLSSVMTNKVQQNVCNEEVQHLKEMLKKTEDLLEEKERFIQFLLAAAKK